MKLKFSRNTFEKIYQKYHRFEYIDPDPLQFLYHYKNWKDQELVGFLTQCFAYGNIKSIIPNLEKILKPMGNSPRDFILGVQSKDLKKIYKNYYYRWHREIDLIELILSLQKVCHEFGSLKSCFLSQYHSKADHILDPLSFLITSLDQHRKKAKKSILTHPARGSACKRLFMFLRWMVRKDQIDLGIWSEISPSQLIMPLDTHIYRISYQLGLTESKQANLKTAIEITSKFKKINPKDPVKYDFSLSRLGIREDLNYSF